MDQYNNSKRIFKKISSVELMVRMIYARRYMHFHVRSTIMRSACNEGEKIFVGWGRIAVISINVNREISVARRSPRYSRDLYVTQTDDAGTSAHVIVPNPSGKTRIVGDVFEDRTRNFSVKPKLSCRLASVEGSSIARSSGSVQRRLSRSAIRVPGSRDILSHTLQRYSNSSIMKVSSISHLPP